MELIIVTGMSGAGKTVALKTLEDMGYYCVDNLPVFLISQFAELGLKNAQTPGLAIGVDTRSGEDLNIVPGLLNELERKNISYKMLYLEASDTVLINRYKASRRAHPLARGGHVEEGILEERNRLMELKNLSDVLIDTSSLTARELKDQLYHIVNGSKSGFKNLVITVMSFGFKYGIPEDADLVFDVRFLKNPYYVDALKEKTGLDSEVSSYVLNDSHAEEYLKLLYRLIDFSIPEYIREGKSQLVIAIGCTGGKHRSVTIAEVLNSHLKDDEKTIVKTIHRDIRL